MKRIEDVMTNRDISGIARACRPGADARPVPTSGRDLIALLLLTGP